MIKNVMVYPLAGATYCTLHEVREALALGAWVQPIECWGYKTGTTALADYMEFCIAKRAESAEAEAQMWKLLANAIIGKFAQRIFDISVDELYKTAKLNGWQVQHLMALTKQQLRALKITEKASVGPIFMPEWNALITGLTRAALSQMLVSGNAVYCATDAVWCKGKPTCDLLPFDVKGKGHVTIVRTRLASMGDKLLPHHSISNRDVAANILDRFDGDTWAEEYLKRRPLAFKEAVIAKQLGIHDLEPYTWVTECRIASTFWDGKRRLLSGGHTAPWANPQEYTQAMGVLKRERAQESPIPL